jgi:hypothetical protein
MDALNLPKYQPPRNEPAYWELRCNRTLVQDALKKAPDYVQVSVFKRRLREMDRYLAAYEKEHGVPRQP